MTTITNSEIMCENVEMTFMGESKITKTLKVSDDKCKMELEMTRLDRRQTNGDKCGYKPVESKTKKSFWKLMVYGNPRSYKNQLRVKYMIHK
jgi:hypothetical protein